MNDYKSGLAYFEIYPAKKNGDPIKGVYEIVEQDKYWLLLRDDTVEMRVSKQSVAVYEVDEKRWPKWLKTS